MQQNPFLFHIDYTGISWLSEGGSGRSVLSSPYFEPTPTELPSEKLNKELSNKNQAYAYFQRLYALQIIWRIQITWIIKIMFCIPHKKITVETIKYFYFYFSENWLYFSNCRKLKYLGKSNAHGHCIQGQSLVRSCLYWKGFSDLTASQNPCIAC